MSTLALALHVVRRDLAENRWIVAGWLVVVALATLGAVRGVGFTGASAMWHFLLPYGALFLAAGLVQVYPPGDAPPGTPVYWQTLPVPLRALLLGRVAAAAVLLCGVPLVGQVMALVALDTPGPQFAGHLAASAVPLGAVVLAGLLVGSLTRSFGGAAVLVVALFILFFPLTFARSMLGADLATLPSSPGGAFALYMVVSGLALWMLSLRHALDPGSRWTRVGAVVLVLALTGGGQSGLFFTVKEPRTWSTVPPQAGDTAFPAAVSDFSLMRVRTGQTGEQPDAEASMQASFRVTPGDGAAEPSLALVDSVTVEDRRGNVLLVRGLPGFTPPPFRSESATQRPAVSTYVQVSIPQRHLEGLRSGALSMVIHGRGVDLQPSDPVELSLELGARFAHRGTRVVVEELLDSEFTVRWSAFTSPLLIQGHGPSGAARADMLGAMLTEFELLATSGESGTFLSRTGSSGGSFGPSGSSDLVVSGPGRGSLAYALTAPTPLAPGSRLRVHMFEPAGAASFRMELPPGSWEQEPR